MSLSEENHQTDEPKNPFLEWASDNQPTILVALFISYTMGAFDYLTTTVQGCIA